MWQFGRWCARPGAGRLARNGELLTIIRVRQTSPMGSVGSDNHSAGTGALPANSPVRSVVVAGGPDDVNVRDL